MKFLKQFAIALLIISIPMMAWAAPDNTLDLKADYMKYAPGTDFNLLDFVKTLINWFFYALLVVALFMLIWIGYIYVTAGGDTKKTGKAMSNLGYVLMGIAIALIAKGLIYAACNIVIGDNSTQICKFW